MLKANARLAERHICCGEAGGIYRLMDFMKTYLLISIPNLMFNSINESNNFKTFSRNCSPNKFNLTNEQA